MAPPYRVVTNPFGARLIRNWGAIDPYSRCDRSINGLPLIRLRGVIDSYRVVINPYRFVIDPSEVVIDLRGSH